MLTATPPARVEYLKLDRRIATGAVLEGEALATLGAAVRQRLVDVLRDIDAGTPLPAWGDSKTCEYCMMDGLCRRQTWDEPADSGNDGAATP